MHVGERGENGEEEESGEEERKRGRGRREYGIGEERRESRERGGAFLLATENCIFFLFI